MRFFPDRFLMAMMMAALAFSARAQQTIIFSKPAEVSADKVNSFLPNSEHRSGDYNAPRSLFNDYTPDLALPPPVTPANNDPSVKEALDKRKNWTLLTPEQILGVQTPEEILGVPDKVRDSEKKLSLEEQFLLRESRSQMTAATNGRAANVPWGRRDEDNPFGFKNQNDENDPLHPSPQKMQLGSRYFNQLMDAPDSEMGPDVKNDSAWNTAFSQPTPPKVTPEQLADMERFRALMEPSSAPEKPVVPTRFSVPATPVPDPFIQAATFVNPAGRDIPPLENTFSKPTGITPLPDVRTPPAKPVTVKQVWQAQLPPWMTEQPPGHNPNRNF